MTIDADVLARMYSQIVQGMTKEDTTLTLDDEHSQAWDAVAADVEQMRGEGVQFEIPGDQPDTVTDLFAGMRTGGQPASPQTTAPSDQPPAPAAEAEQEPEADDE